jgi:hypothetical protein
VLLALILRAFVVKQTGRGRAQPMKAP